MTTDFRHESLKNRHKIVSVTFLNFVIYRASQITQSMTFWKRHEIARGPFNLVRALTFYTIYKRYLIALQLCVKGHSWGHQLLPLPPPFKITRTIIFCFVKTSFDQELLY